MTVRLRRQLIDSLLTLLIPTLWLVVIVPNPDGFPFWRGASYSDLLISHWPNAFYLRQSIFKWGQIPLWNPTTLGGAPFAADPLSGLWYPPNWLTLVMPISLAFNLLFWLHLAWAAWGTRRLMRSEGVGLVGGWIAALAFSGTPKFLAHIGLGHFGLVCAVSWTPWVVLTTRRMVDEVCGRRGGWLRWSALTGATLGVVALADPRWALPAGLLALVYGLRRAVNNQREQGSNWSWPAWRRLLMAGAVTGTSASAIVACLALPLLEFLPLSTRWGISIGDQTTLSLPGSQILSVILPQVSQPEWMAYLGIAVCCLAFIAVLIRAPEAGFWSAIVIGAWLLSLGDQTPLYALFTKIIPGSGLLRVPPRILFIASFGAAIMAGRGLDWVLTGDHEPSKVKIFRLAVIGLMSAVILLISGVWLLSRAISALLLGAYVLAFLTALWALLSLAHRLPRNFIALGWVLLVIVDLMWINTRLLEVRPSTTLLDERAVLVESLAGEVGTWRLYSPSYSLPYATAVRKSKEMADGVNPLQLKAYRDYMALSTGFSPDNYSVTLPPFPSGEPDRPWGVDLDPAMLGRLNIRYIVSEYPVDTPGIHLQDRLEGVYVYRNEVARPRAWVEEPSAGPSSNWRPAESLEWTPNRITIHARGPGLLVLSEVDYPGWIITVDGIQSEGHLVDNLLRGVTLLPGDHEVVFSFQPKTVFLGCGITLFAMLSLVILWLRR